MKQLFRNLLVGSKPISSIGTYKYALLRGQFAFIMIFCCLFYIIYNWMLDIYVYIPYYIGGIVIAALVIYLNRNAHYKGASIILLLTINLLVYLFSDIQEPFGSVFFFYSICALAGIVFLRAHSKPLSYLFGLFPFAVGLMAFYGDLNIIGDNVPSGYNFTINFTLSIFFCLLFVQFLMDRNEEEISERKLIEEELKVQNELLTKTNKELDHFVYSVSHDLRAPLSSISGLTNLFSMTKSSQEREEINQMIKKRIKDLEAFIKEVLDYSRNERLEINLASTSPYAVMNKIVGGLDHMIGFDEVKLENKIDPSFVVNTDPERLKVIFTNLLVNAITYRDKSKPNCFISVETADLGDRWQFIIKDNGIGIKEEHHDKIFDMFFRADGHEGSGSGLGLYIVNETVARLQGAVNLESKHGEGSTFTITFTRIT